MTEPRLRVVFWQRAAREAEADRLTLQQIESSTAAGECIEDYPTDPRGPSCLAILITAYIPDPQLWTADFRTGSTRDDEAE